MPGDAASEAAHQFDAGKSETIKGALEQAARRLLPGQEQTWEGGRVSFTIKVDPERPNYLTARFWGGEPLRMTDLRRALKKWRRPAPAPAEGTS